MRPLLMTGKVPSKFTAGFKCMRSMMFEYFSEQIHQKGCFHHTWKYVSMAFESAGLEVPDLRELRVPNHVVDTDDLPRSW